MKTKIIYIAVFVSAFVLTTAVIIYLNNQYKNIFKFDFATVEAKTFDKVKGKPGVNNFAELKNYIQTEFRKDLLDSIRSYKTEIKHDTVRMEIIRDSLLADSLKKFKAKMHELNSNLASKESEVNTMKSALQVKNDSAYVKWKREMVKIYESMDSKAAAKIIQNLADNLARDILFSMKKKKAAEIITKLNPETATRLTRLQ